MLKPKEMVAVSLLIAALTLFVYGLMRDGVEEALKTAVGPKQSVEAPLGLRMAQDDQTPMKVVSEAERADSEPKKDMLTATPTATPTRAERREARYGVAKAPSDFKVTVAKKRTIIPREDLEATIRETFRRLPHIRTTPELVAFMSETAIVESMNGRFLVGKLKGGKDSGDYGLYQIRIHTAKDTMSWLKREHKDVYDSLQSLYDDTKPLRWNLIHNVPYGTALAVTYYWRRDPERLTDGIGCMESRASFWKKEYNTRYGKGSVAAYLKRVNDFHSKKDTI